MEREEGRIEREGECNVEVRGVLWRGKKGFEVKRGR